MICAPREAQPLLWTGRASAEDNSGLSLSTDRASELGQIVTWLLFANAAAHGSNAW